ncbi:Regulator of G-protein signaling loco [Nymphon striatum]|nr:Regulator of G-protein signaling loco [Nymphon striatum]
MHPSRRRKKRPNYGVRTIELTRGTNGFGFTISGQVPCILSCIVNGSPAELAGLRPGDYLIAVNNLNVSKVPHDDVVRLIGQTQGILKLQISENIFNSDSSEEEFLSANRHKPKYPNRVRHKQNANSSVYRAEKVVKDLQTGALFSDKGQQGGQLTSEDSREDVCQKVNHDDKKVADVSATVHSNKAIIELMLQQRMREVVAASCANINASSNVHNYHQLTNKNAGNHSKVKSRKRSMQRTALTNAQNLHLEIPKESYDSDSENFLSAINFTEQELNNILYPSLQNAQKTYRANVQNSIVNFRAVVGYLGTIEMPKEPQVPGSRLQAIRNCIRRLRIEKKVHTLVLLSVYSDQVLLTNPHGLTLAEYPAEKITFSGVHADDKKFFGLVTGQTFCADDFSEGSQDENISVSSSCHVFMVDARIQPHYKHTKRARVFKIECTIDPESNQCQEFPDSAAPILQAISALYRNRQMISGQNNVQHPFLPEPGILGAPGLVNVDGHLSPQRSNTSSNSSNSDSGIGFRDEAGSHNSDRMFIVDLLDNSANLNRRSCYQSEENRVPPKAIGAGTNLSTSDSSLHQIAKSSSNIHGRHSHRNTPTAGVSHSAQASPLTVGELHTSTNSPNRLTVRAMPDPVGYLQAPLNNSSQESEQSFDKPNTNVQRESIDTQIKEVHKYAPKVHNNDKKSAVDQRLNVRAMADVPIKSRISPIITEVLNGSCDFLKNKTQSPVTVIEKNSRSSTSGKKPTLSPLTIERMQQSVVSSPTAYKLSPKVYGLVIDTTADNTYEIVREPVVESTDEDDDDSQDAGHHHLAWSSTTSQYSDHLDSEVESDVKNTKVWIGDSYMKRLSSRKRNSVKTREDVSGGRVNPTECSASLLLELQAMVRESYFSHRSQELAYLAGAPLHRDHPILYSNSEVGTVSDGELASSGGCSSAKPVSSSATSSMIGLDRISTETTTSIQGTSNTENMSSRCSSVTDHEQGGIGRVTSWSIGFEKLLDDPAGMHTFAEFLKSEFSQENILFWVASERYKLLKDANQMKTRAKEIYEKHLGLGASEPVNVDSHARQEVQENLENPTTELFSLAQKQIFDLMKLDSYPRFLKCQLYKDSAVQELAGLPLSFPGDYNLNVNITWEQLSQIERDKVASKPQKGKEEGEEKRKKSILPWQFRGKSKNSDAKLEKEVDMRRSWRKKKKDSNKENKWSSSVRDDVSVPSSDLTGSRSSLASVDLEQIQRHTASRESLASSDYTGESLKKDATDLYRIILPDQSTTVVQVRPQDTIRDLLQRLSDHRTINISSAEVFSTNNEKVIDPNTVISKITCKELKIDQRMFFQVNLPNKKTIGVRARSSKSIMEVLKPILQKYGFKPDNIVVHLNDEEKTLNLNSQWGYRISNSRSSLPNKYSKYSTSLNEITNKVFEDLLKGKAIAKFDELGVIDLDQKSNFDDQASSLSDTRSSSSHQSGLLNLVRRSSFHLDYSKNHLTHKSKMNMLDFGNVRSNASESVSNLRALDSKPPLPKPRTKVNQARLSDNEAISEMFEVWKRSQRNRLEDQRGTEINGELPEFLKPKPDQKEGVSKYKRTSAVKHTKGKTSENRLSYTGTVIDDVIELPNNMPLTCYDFVKDGGIIPNHQQAEEFFRAGDSCNIFDSNFDKKLSLGDIGLATRSANRNRVYSAFTPSNRMRKVVRRPVSHPVFGSESDDYLVDMPVYPTMHSISQNRNLAESENIKNSSDGELDKTLECANDLDLDSLNDLDVTLKVDADNKSFSPSCIPPPEDINNSSIHVDPANYSPPSPLRSGALHAFKVEQVSSRLSSPPPLPPKPKLRGPPPRPPSRPQSETPASTQIISPLSPVQQAKIELRKQAGRSRKPVSFYMVDDRTIYVSAKLLLGLEDNLAECDQMRRLVQGWTAYTKLYKDLNVKNIVKKIKNGFIGSNKSFKLLLGAAVFNWESNKITDFDLQRCINDFDHIDRLNDHSSCNSSDLPSGETNNDSSNGSPNDEVTDNDSCWEKLLDKDHLKIWRKPLPGSNLYEYKVYGSFYDVPPHAFFSIQVDLEYRKKWDKHIFKLDVIDSDPESGCEVVHWIAHFPVRFLKFLLKLEFN